jgi:Cdc6-like AAA superfamily ATPase
MPLIITGKPGSSKTLAMNLILKHFKGKLSNDDFFKSYPNLISYYFQGSE